MAVEANVFADDSLDFPAGQPTETDSLAFLDGSGTPMTDQRVVEHDGVTATYSETDAERILEFDREGATAAIAQNVDGYAMLKVRPTPQGDELERYYGFDMALDHAAELLGVSPHELPVPEAAEDMGM